MEKPNIPTHLPYGENENQETPDSPESFWEKYSVFIVMGAFGVVALICFLFFPETFEEKDDTEKNWKALTGLFSKDKENVDEKDKKSTFSLFGKKYSNYIAACEAGDFEAAQSMAEKIRTEAEKYRKKHIKKVDTNIQYPEHKHYRSLMWEYEEAIRYIQQAQTMNDAKDYIAEHDFQTATANNKFDEAYTILEQAEKDGYSEAFESIYKKEIRDLRRDVFEQELKFLIQQNNPASDTKILYMLKEAEIKEELFPNELRVLRQLCITLAEAIGNDELAEKLSKNSR